MLVAARVRMDTDEDIEDAKKRETSNLWRRIIKGVYMVSNKIVHYRFNH